MEAINIEAKISFIVLELTPTVLRLYSGGKEKLEQVFQSAYCC